MSYRMWKPNKSNDFKFIDSVIAEQYHIGGVDMWLYTYAGPKGNNGSTDSTLPDYSQVVNPPLTGIGDLVLGETNQRKYNVEAITIPAVYQIQEATPDLKIPGMWFNFDTMDITIHYNTMMQRVGRKIIAGDVIELPNLRDPDVLDLDKGINRFYVVQDGFRTSEGYSATWQNHIYKLRVKPITDSPEYEDILGNENNNFPDNPNDPNNGNGNSTGSGGGNSTYDKELDIMNKIIAQADSEVPYIHWDNEHIYDDISGINQLARYIISGNDFPVNPSNRMFFIKTADPVLFEKNNGIWGEISAQVGDKLPNTALDGAFFFLANSNDRTGHTLYQYYTNESRWHDCILPYTSSDSVPVDAEDFYVKYSIPTLYQVLDDGKTWVIPEESPTTVPFTTKDIASNRINPHDMRNSIPPARDAVGNGIVFPDNPSDGMYFYRTDYVPVTLWQYSSSDSKWKQFNYGGRLPWTGANREQTNYINSPDRVSIQDVVKPNTRY